MPTRDEIIRDLPVYLEGCASCAIEGNQFGREIIDLWNSGKMAEAIDRLVEDVQKYLSPPATR